MITFKKKENKQLTKHFNSSEFECPCKQCKNANQYISLELLELLEKVREAYGHPIVVTSGYRCPAHNVKIGGAKSSSHLAGLAADISPKLITLDDLDTLYEICYNTFSNIGDGRNKKFIHVDVRPAKPSGKRHWIYT
jgi:uncharacterized protein YcbK (DUF882 family)